MDTPITTSSTTPETSKETTAEVIGGYAVNFGLFGIAGIVFHAISRRLRQDQKDRIFDGVMDAVLPTKKK